MAVPPRCRGSRCGGDATTIRQASSLALERAVQPGGAATRSRDSTPCGDVAGAIEEVRRIAHRHGAAPRRAAPRRRPLRTTPRRGRERVKRASPYDERAHRLAIAAQLQRRDRGAIARRRGRGAVDARRARRRAGAGDGDAVPPGRCPHRPRRRLGGLTRWTATAVHAQRGRRAPDAAAGARTASSCAPRLLDRVSRRFQVPLTVIVAGAGFGKSTLLAQAIRANQADPRGDRRLAVVRARRLRCRPPGRRQSSTPSATAATAANRSSGCSMPSAQVGADRRVRRDRRDPRDLPPRSSAAALLGELVGRLPPHAHLVARRPQPHHRSRSTVVAPPVTWSRSTIDELAFTPTEVDAVARLARPRRRHRTQPRPPRRLAVARAPRPLGARGFGAAVPVGRGRRRPDRPPSGAPARPRHARLGDGR